MEHYSPYIDSTNRRLNRFDLKRASNQALINHIDDVLREAAEPWAIHWSRGTFEARGRWAKAMPDLTGIDDGLKIMTATLGPNKSTETIN